MMVTGTLAEKGFQVFNKEFHAEIARGIPRIWIVVADGVQAHIFRKAGKGIERIAHAKPGHSAASHQDNGGTAFHGYDVRSEKSHHGEGAFIKNLAVWLDEAERAKSFDRLVLVADPRTLGDLRAGLGDQVQLRVVAEEAKDLVKLSDQEILHHLEGVVWF
jgi:protein required for attachment to host cells